MNILIVGFPYVRKNFSDTFNYFPEENNVYFLLPQNWKVKGGKVVYKPERGDNVFLTPTFFHHSNYPLFGGILKGFMPLFPLDLMKIKNKKRLDLVYICSEPNLLSTLYFSVWTRTFGLKTVNFTWENIDPRTKFKGLKGWFQIFILKLNLILCDGIICGNKKGQEIINNMIPLKKTAHIPMSGVNAKFFARKNVKKELNGVDLRGKTVFTFAGAISKRKGFDILIDSIKDLSISNPDIYLVLVGSGEYEESLKLKIRNLKLENLVLLIPWADHNDLVDILSVSDVFLYPSISYGGWEEQFGYSMAEASLMELPVISTKTGSIDEVVIDGETGILIEPENKEQLINAMKKLAEEESLRKKIGKAGRDYITSNFSNFIVAGKFKDFFDLILGKNK